MPRSPTPKARTSVSGSGCFERATPVATANRSSPTAPASRPALRAANAEGPRTAAGSARCSPARSPSVRFRAMPGATPRPRVLLVITLAEVGGAQSYVAALLPALAERYDVVLAAYGEGPLRRGGRPGGSAVRPAAARAAADPSAAGSRRPRRADPALPPRAASGRAREQLEGRRARPAGRRRDPGAGPHLHGPRLGVLRLLRPGVPALSGLRPADGAADDRDHLRLRAASSRTGSRPARAAPSAAS